MTVHPQIRFMNLVLVAGLIGFGATALAAQPESSSTAGKYFYVYADADSTTNHYIPSGFMGDFNDVSIKTTQRLNPQSGSSCLRFTYNPSPTLMESEHWAGIQWQNPEGNWGIRDGGIDLTGAKRLTFWARGKNGGEKIDKFQVGGIFTGAYPDSDQESVGPIILSKDWKQYTIDLSDSDLSYMAGGFAWATSSQSAPNGATFYLDEIRYEY